MNPHISLFDSPRPKMAIQFSFLINKLRLSYCKKRCLYIWNSNLINFSAKSSTAFLRSVRYWSFLKVVKNIFLRYKINLSIRRQARSPSIIFNFKLCWNEIIIMIFTTQLVNCPFPCKCKVKMNKMKWPVQCPQAHKNLLFLNQAGRQTSCMP